MKTHFSIKEIIAKLEISKSYFMKLRTNTKNIKYDKQQGGYSLEEVCQAIVTRPYKRRDSTDLRRKALNILDEIKKNKDLLENPDEPAKNVTAQTAIETKAPEQTEQPKQPKPLPEKASDTNKKQSQSKHLDEFGLKGALYRVRLMEKLVYKEAKSKLTPEALDNWSRLVGDLIKTEEKILKILRERKELVAVAAVNKWLASRLEYLKTTLLNIPAKVAPALDGMPWTVIQNKLNEEIRDSVEKIRNFDPDEEEKENAEQQNEDVSTNVEEFPENAGAS